MSVILMSYIWANRLATNENLMIHFCKHYSSMPIDSFKICLNVNSDVDDSAFFTEIFRSNLNRVDISIDKRNYKDSNRIDFMHSFMNEKNNFFIPVDCDEFIDYDLGKEVSILEKTKYPCMHGKLIDRVYKEDDKIKLINPNLTDNISDQYPLEENISSKIGRGHNKVVLIKGNNRLMPGHHYHVGFRESPAHPNRKIKVMHYCWTINRRYDLTNRRDKNLPNYKKIISFLDNSSL